MRHLSAAVRLVVLALTLAACSSASARTPRARSNAADALLATLRFRGDLRGDSTVIAACSVTEALDDRAAVAGLPRDLQVRLVGSAGDARDRRGRYENDDRMLVFVESVQLKALDDPGARLAGLDTVATVRLYVRRLTKDELEYELAQARDGSGDRVWEVTSFRRISRAYH